MVLTINANYFIDRLVFTMTAKSALCEIYNLLLRITQTNAGLQGVNVKCNKINFCSLQLLSLDKWGSKTVHECCLCVARKWHESKWRRTKTMAVKLNTATQLSFITSQQYLWSHILLKGRRIQTKVFFNKRSNTQMTECN